MSWWGKLVGGTFGFMIGGPIGALIGAAFGHSLDRGVSGLHDQAGLGAESWGRERVQTAFFTATFSVMGHVAKADGQVTTDEIRLAQAAMGQMGLSTEHQRVAMRLFNEGKRADFPLDGVLAQFRRECHRRRNLMQMFIELQLHAAYADGVLHPKERALLQHVCDKLGFSARDFARIEEMIKAERRFAGDRARPQVARMPVEDAYALLGVSASATEAEVKKAYRRLMSQHHPDKLVAKGLPEEMMKIATEKTQDIKAAYDRIRQARSDTS